MRRAWGSFETNNLMLVFIPDLIIDMNKSSLDNSKQFDFFLKRQGDVVSFQNAHIGRKHDFELHEKALAEMVRPNDIRKHELVVRIRYSSDVVQHAAVGAPANQHVCLFFCYVEPSRADVD